MREEMIVVEREQLERYLSQKDEIGELRYKLEHLGEGDSLVGNSTIFDYTTGFPKPQAVVGKDRERERRIQERYETRLKKLQTDCEETEQWVESIYDSQTRRIFRMRYLEGKTLEQVGKKTYMDKSTVSRKIDNFLKIATNATNAII